MHRQPEKLTPEKFEHHSKALAAMVKEEIDRGVIYIKFIHMKQHLTPLLRHLVAEGRFMDGVIKGLSEIVEYDWLETSVRNYMRGQKLVPPGSKRPARCTSSFDLIRDDRYKRLLHL
jgi:hypothetical protein